MSRPPSSVPPASRRAHLILGLLFALNLLNYIDRFVLAAVESRIQLDLLPGSSADVQKWMGLLPTAFLLSYMVTAPLFGWLADRVSRWWIIGLGVIVWSLASGASGLATSFAMLVITRLFIGVGEAAYGPAAPTVLADLFPIERRGQILSLLYLAIPVGSALGYMLGGSIADHWSWRDAFFMSMPPGIVLGLVCLGLRDKRMASSTAAASPARRQTLADYRQLLRTPSFVLNTLGMAAMTFALGAVAFWLPRYVCDFRREDLPLDVAPSLARVNLLVGAITVAAGITATLVGGWLADRLRPRWPGSYFLVSGLGMLVGTPLFLLVLVTPFPMAWGLIFLAEFCLLLNTGPANAILANVTQPAIRASAFAINIFVIHLLGDAASPLLVGAINDWSGGNMNVGFAFVSLAIAASGVIWTSAAPFLGRDTAAVRED